MFSMTKNTLMSMKNWYINLLLTLNAPRLYLIIGKHEFVFIVVECHMINYVNERFREKNSFVP